VKHRNLQGIAFAEKMMLDTTETYSLTTLMVGIGPVLLGIAIAYGIYMYRGRSRVEKRYSQDATKQLYRKAAKQESKGVDTFSQ
jgi:hypothetical protein